VREETDENEGYISKNITTARNISENSKKRLTFIFKVCNIIFNN
jgi:hypothetical protein